MTRSRRASARTPRDELAAGLDRFRAQHLVLGQRRRARRQPKVLVNAAESPVAWLAQRGLLAPHQVQAAERLRADFTRAQLSPHLTLDWTRPRVDASRAPTSLVGGEAAVAARQRVSRALAAVGAEFSGLLLDVCCFLKPLGEVERERRWPARSGKVVLDLALERLARHYGLGAAARGKARAPTRTWIAPADAAAEAEGEAAASAAARID